jgi:hypothetical protein
MTFVVAYRSDNEVKYTMYTLRTSECLKFCDVKRSADFVKRRELLIHQKRLIYEKSYIDEKQDAQSILRCMLSIEKRPPSRVSKRCR